MTTMNENNNHINKSIKVKVFYTLRGSKSTRLTTFSINTTTNDENSDLSCIPISLKACLWSICSSSPDIICRDHDLSIYTANFHESLLTTEKQLQRDSLIWEGHGLLTWLMDSNSNAADDIQIHGKASSTSNNCIDIYIELQPTMKWIKDDYFSALRNKSFEQFKSSSLTPLHPICNCYSSSSSNNEQLLLSSSPTLPPHLGKDTTEFDRYLSRHRLPPPPPPLPPPTNQDASSSPPLPSRLSNGNSSIPVFRPEPIYSAKSTTTTNDYNNNKRSRLNSPPYYSNNSKEDLTLPIPTSMNNNRRSAFTIASISENTFLPLPTSTVTTATATSDSSNNSSSGSPPMTRNDNIPVIYTPSNKKRKKNPILMPSSSSSSSSVIENHYNHHNNGNSSTRNSCSIYKQQTLPPPPPQPQPQPQPSLPAPQSPMQQQGQQQGQQQQQQQQQVNTVVRTYYEVDRDSQGEYILPVEIDSWTVVDLGTVIYERPAYHNQRYIYPANYTVRKWYRSMVDPKSDTQYTCRILENGREPKFEVTADDCPMTYSGPTPTTVWTIIVRRAFAIRNQEYGHNPVGPDFFGLRKNTIAKMIQDLPNASKCSQYVWQTFEPARFNKPGRNRRRADSTLPGSLLGGVNYGLTSSRLIHNTNLSATQQASSYASSSSRTTSNPSSPPQPQQQQQQQKGEEEEEEHDELEEDDSTTISTPRMRYNHRSSAST